MRRFIRQLLIISLVLIWVLLIVWYFRNDIPLLEPFLGSVQAVPECQLETPTAAVENENTCTIKIGVINTFSSDGTCHSGGTEHKRGYELALNEINSMGGINGCQVELVQYDDGGDSVTAGTAVIELARQGSQIEESIPLIIGAYTSQNTLVAAKEADRQRIPLIIPSASSSLITRLGYEWVFRINAVSTDYVDQAIMLTNELNEAPTIAIIHENTLFGESAAVAVIAKAEQQGIGVAALETYQPDEDSDGLESSINSLKSANPDVVYLISNNINDAIKILDLSRSTNFEPQLFIANAGAFVSPDFLNQAGTEIENVVVTAQWAEDVDWHYEGESPMDAANFIALFQQTYGGDMPGMRSVQTYTSLRLAKDVIERAQNDAACNSDIIELRSCIQTELRDIELEHTLFGAINFDNSSGQNNHPVLLVQIVCDGGSDANGDCASNNFHFATIYPEEYKTQEIILSTTKTNEE